MDSIDQKIEDAFAAFEREPDPELLYAALNEVEDVQRNAKTEDRDACNRGLSLLLNFLGEVDKQTDPKWNPNDEPLTVELPRLPDDAPDNVNSQLDPADIADPELRDRYERALKTNFEAARRYDAQFQLRRVEERAIDDLKLFAERCFTDSPDHREQFRELLDSSPLRDRRKRSLRKTVRPRIWPIG